MLNLTEDTKQRMKATVLFIITGFKTIMATLLSLFVYQRCENEIEECSLRDNVTNLTVYNEAVVIFNFVTLGIFVGMYILEFYRENWCIKYLDISNFLPNDNLRTEIVRYPDINDKLIKLNKHYYKYSLTLVIFNIVNFIISAILISQFYG